MARPIWRGMLSFGLVAIPVQLHTAVREHRQRFRLLHAKDKSPIKYERVCQRDGKPVAWEDLVKGYEYERGRYVVLTKEDFKSAALERDRRVNVTDFVPAEDIDDRFFDHPYYLLPDKGGEQAYAIFRDALKQAGRIGIGKVILRDRQHLVAIKSLDDHLMLTMVRFSDEIVEAPRMPEVDRVKVPARDLKLATGLIEALAAEWKPGQYTDDYQQNLQKIIKAKLKGKTFKLEDEGRPMSAEVVDLAERLRASLRIAGPSRPTRSRSTKKKKRAA